MKKVEELQKELLHKQKKEKNSALVREIVDDYNKRKLARLHQEAVWRLNSDFIKGKQFSFINGAYQIATASPVFDWAEHKVYNRIAPTIENRLAKFARVNCKVVVRPASSDDNDINSAKLASRLIDGTQTDNDFFTLQARANYLSEVYGTAFWKVFYENNRVKIVPVSPFEIFPDSLTVSEINDCESIIHAKNFSVNEISSLYKVPVEEIKLNNSPLPVSNGERSAEVIEKYCRPSRQYPDGRLVIIAGENLVFDGILPYLNGDDGERGFPFIKQGAYSSDNEFFARSVIERLIPVQRAYNAVKNRKNEYLARLSVGVIAVEEGSVDLDLLDEEGLPPGKVLVYRQGSTPPQVMPTGGVPAEFRDEEARLLQEISDISGVSGAVNSASIISNSISGYALSLLLEQDYSRLSVTTEGIRNAVRNIGKHILRLYKQFAKTEKLLKTAGTQGKCEVLSFTAADLTSDDVVLEVDSEMQETPAVRRNMVMDLVKNGILAGENGAISERDKARALEMLGFGNWESAKNTEEAHLKRAEAENSELRHSSVDILDADGHSLHAAEHSRYLASNRQDLSPDAVARFEEHIATHKSLQKLLDNIEK
ncbi:MAG: hypothetical protein LBN25_04780 [Christensenellaceae bacterium]|jgi:hypothetical protein|nr:hypothetical protein [Christensenellaceae bacterium]